MLGVRTNGQATAMPPPVVKQPSKATPIHVPSNADFPRAPRPIISEPDYEAFDMGAADTPEYRVSAEDTEKALRDLMADVKNEETAEINDEDTIVPGFRSNIRLMPHQVVARKWMKERETGKRLGGILADDMGYVPSCSQTRLS